MSRTRKQIVRNATIGLAMVLVLGYAVATDAAPKITQLRQVVVRGFLNVMRPIINTKGAVTVGDDLNVHGAISRSTGPVKINDGLTQLGTDGVSFAGNVDATSGLDVSGGDLTVGATKFVVNQTSGLITSASVDATSVVDTTRYISFPLRSFVECQTDAGADIGFDTTADALPDFVNSATDGTGLILRFDDVTGTEDQNSEVCNNFTVPPDYASGGHFRVRALKDAHAGATEVMNCAVSVNGAALQTAGTVTVSVLATTPYSCTPTIASLAANDSVSYSLSITSGTTMDDQVDIASVEFVYTATQ